MDEIRPFQIKCISTKHTSAAEDSSTDQVIFTSSPFSGWTWLGQRIGN